MRGRRVKTPADLYGPLFDAVQTQQVFADGKTFVDAVPREPVEAIVAAFVRDEPSGKTELEAFVRARFDVPSISGAIEMPREASVRGRIRALWPELTRGPSVAVDGGSALALDAPFVVPGGRFRELFYWDSYFTMLGLRADGQDELIEAMVDNFTDLIERYGHVPNATRSYFLSRSQPPAYHLMCALSRRDDRGVLARRLAAMAAEHAYWMRGAEVSGRGAVSEHVVRLPDGAVLNRYWDASDSPREESFREDVMTAQDSGRPAAEVYRDLRAGAESGWDFSSRWLADGRSLATIRTTDMVAVDLNSLLFGLEQAIARRSGGGAAARRFEEAAQARAAAMNAYLWDGGQGCFVDYDWRRGERAGGLTAASVAPLWTGVATSAQAVETAAIIERDLLASGGMRTTCVETGQQWDRPNGWAPLQWMAIEGLERYGMADLARIIAERWVATVQREYARSGHFLEKYDIEAALPGAGGEYPVQIGFGWTNGVTAALMDRYGVA